MAICRRSVRSVNLPPFAHRIEASRPDAFKTLSEKARQLVGGPASASPVNGRSPLLVALDERRIDLFIDYCSARARS